MKILFDLSAAQPVSGNDFHGGGEYAKVIFYKLCEFMLYNDFTLEVFYTPGKNIDKALIDTCREKNILVNFCRNNNELSGLLLQKKYDVFYSALPYSYFNLIVPSETKFIYTIHGLRNLEYPTDKYELKYKKSNIKERIKYFLYLFFPAFLIKHRIKNGIANFEKLFCRTKNQTVVTISNHSRYSILYFFPYLDVSQIEFFYSPIKKSESASDSDLKILNSLLLSPQKYILLIGGDRSEKGAYRACKVLYRLFKNHTGIPSDIKVLVLGVSYFRPYIKLTNHNPRFIFHTYVSTKDLETLYKNAFLFMYPTMNEGFGYPPLEAMKYGTLCACSANSAITEIYGDSVLYFNPFDETEMSIRVLQSFNEDIRKEKQEKAAIRYKLIRERQEQDLDNLVKKIISRK